MFSFFTVLLRCFKSTHILTLPFFLATGTIGAHRFSSVFIGLQFRQPISPNTFALMQFALATCSIAEAALLLRRLFEYCPLTTYIQNWWRTVFLRRKKNPHGFHIATWTVKLYCCFDQRRALWETLISITGHNSNVGPCVNLKGYWFSSHRKAYHPV